MDEHLTWKHLRTLYFALIQPHLTYGLLACGNAKNFIMHKTQILQKRALPFINKAHYNSHTDSLFKKSQILKIKDMYEFQTALFMHDYRANKMPFSFDNVLKQNCEFREHRLTRQSDLLNVARCQSTFSQNRPLYQFPITWNKWLRKIPNSNLKTSFKNQLKSHLFAVYSVEVRCNYSHCKDCQ